MNCLDLGFRRSSAWYPVETSLKHLGTNILTFIPETLRLTHTGKSIGCLRHVDNAQNQ